MINTQLSTFSLLIIVNIILLKSTPIYEQDEIINLLPGVDKWYCNQKYLFFLMFLHSESKMHI